MELEQTLTVMRAMHLEQGALQYDDQYPRPRPNAGEALVQVSLAGICSTDLELVAGYKGGMQEDDSLGDGFRGILGHEFVGQIVAVAPGFEEWVGTRVVGEINIGCGECGLCQRGLANHCRNRQVLGIIERDGAFADYLTLPVANLHRVPEDVSDRQAVFVEPLAAALQIVSQLHVRPADRVYVLGDGRLGLLVAQVLALSGCQLTVIGRNARKLSLLEQVGTGASVDTSVDSLDALSENPADVVVEATGAVDGFATARQLVRPGGVIVLKSTYAAALAQFDVSSVVVDEITLIGSRCGPFAPALRLLAAGRIEVEAMIDACYPLSQAVEAMHHAGQKGVIKVLLAP